jgi:hypothetical protein
MAFLSHLAAVVLLTCVSGAPAFPFQQGGSNAEANTRSVKGVVTTSDGKPAAGAVVLLKDTKTLQVRSFVTKEDGTYRFSGLSTNNDYQIRAQLNGVSSNVKTLTSFDNRKEATVDLKLK